MIQYIFLKTRYIILILLILMNETYVDAKTSTNLENWHNEVIKKLVEPGRPKKFKNLFLLNGTLASIKAIKETKEDIRAYKDYSEILIDSFKFSDKTFYYQYRVLIRDKKLPTIVILAGLKANLVGRFAKVTMSLLSKLKDYNVIILETLTSSSSIQRNHFVSLGGLHEAKYLLEALKNYRQKFDIQSNEVVFTSGSTSTFGTFHSAPLLKKNGFNPSHLFLMAGYNDIRPMLQLFCELDFKDKKTRSEKCLNSEDKYYKGYKKIFTNLAGKFLSKLNVAYYRSESFGRKYPDFKTRKKFLGLYSLVEQGFNEYKHDLEDLYFEIYNKPIEFTDVFDYYRKINLENNLSQNDIFTYWIHAKDDPMASYRDQVKRLNSKISENNYQNVFFQILNQGGHGAYGRLYGRKWVLDNIVKFYQTKPFNNLSDDE